jgi:cytoskeletal protein RodZ
MIQLKNLFIVIYQNVVMKKSYLLLILIIISLLLVAGCTSNSAKHDTATITSKEQKNIQPTQVTTPPTVKITTIPTPKYTAVSTPIKTNVPTPEKTAVPTVKRTTAPTNKNYQQSSSNDAVSCPAGKCWVNPYTKKDGTEVRGYCRKC